MEILLEEPSAQAFLEKVLRRLLPADVTWKTIVFQGKQDLLSNVERRLRAYQRFIQEDWRVVVLVDRDQDDCNALKMRLEAAAANAQLRTKSSAKGGTFTVLNRIAIEELEAWFLGDSTALRTAFPRVSPTYTSKARFRDPDAVQGGTAEALEQLLQTAGYYGAGMPKVEIARNLAPHIDPTRNISTSFRCFVSGLNSLW